jgi:hypothetical protein
VLLHRGLQLAREVPPQSDARRVLTEWNDAAERGWEEVVLVYRGTLGLEPKRQAT